MNSELESLAQAILEAYHRYVPHSTKTDRQYPTRQTSPDSNSWVSYFVYSMTYLSRPGSGKSTTAYPLTDRLNTLLGHPTHSSHLDPRGDIASPAPQAGAEGEIAICVGLDGWHYSRAELDTFPDPQEAHWRRVRLYVLDKMILMIREQHSLSIYLHTSLSYNPYVCLYPRIHPPESHSRHSTMP